MRTALTDLLGVEHPIVGFNRSPAVVAAVTPVGTRLLIFRSGRVPLKSTRHTSSPMSSADMWSIKGEP